MWRKRRVILPKKDCNHDGQADQDQSDRKIFDPQRELVQTFRLDEPV